MKKRLYQPVIGGRATFEEATPESPFSPQRKALFEDLDNRRKTLLICARNGDSVEDLGIYICGKFKLKNPFIHETGLFTMVIVKGSLNRQTRKRIKKHVKKLLKNENVINR